MGPLLSTAEVAEVTGWSDRWIRKQVDRTERGLYRLSSLPAEAQRAWTERHRVVEMVQPAPAAEGQLTLALTVPVGPNLSPEDRAEAEGRYRVIEPLVAPEKHIGLWARWKRKGPLIEWLAREHAIRARTIYTWAKAFRERGLPGLVSRDRADKGRPRVLNNAALHFLLAAALPDHGRYGQWTVAEIYRAYQEERAWRAAHVGRALGEFEVRKYARYLEDGARLSASAQLPAASYETFRAWYDRIPEVVRVMGREGEEAFSNTQEVISFRELNAIQPLQYVVMDHRRLDLFCLVREGKGWKLMRPWLTAAIDMRTRKWLAWAIVQTPSSDSIATVLKRTFLMHGLPQALYWDNGKDFTCEWFEGKRVRAGNTGRIGELGPAWSGVIETLGIRVHHAIVRRARAKIIEPNFVRTAAYDRSTPWWCGNKPSARPERFDALLEQHERWLAGEAVGPAFPTIEEVSALYSEEMAALNERDLAGEGMQKVMPTGRGWMCPNECWEKLIGGVERRVAPAEVLQFAFAKRRVVTVQHGEVRATFGGRAYHYRFSDNPVRMMTLNGREVEVAFDPLDLETVAVYYESRFEGLAHNVELRRMGERAFVEDEKLRRAARREVKRAIAAAHRDVYVPGVIERAARRAEVMPARVEPERVQIAAAVAPAVMAAAEAARPAPVEVIEVGRLGVVETGSDEGEFEFFGGTK